MTITLRKAITMWGRALILFAGLFVGAASAWAQDDEEPPLPDPEDITLETVDNVVIKATYWEPREPSKSTVPIILLHGWEGNRKEYDLLGRALQEHLGHAVIAIDLRGHGGSVIRKNPLAGKDDVIDPEKMVKQDFDLMGYDVHAAKNFLMDKHKEGKLNIELLTIVGADMGAIVAMQYAVYDWNRPKVPVIRFRTGQNVRGLVLLSPPRTFNGMTYEVALKDPVVRGAISTMIIVGDKDRKAYGDAKSLHSTLSRYHVKIPADATQAERRDKMDLFLIEKPTTLQGTALLADALKTDALIKEFIDARLVAKSDDVPWMERESR